MLDLATKRVGFDFETFLIRPALLAPPPVCLTVSNGVEHGIFHARELTADDFERLILAPGGLIVGANLAFDMGVACAKWPDLIPAVFEAYDRGRCRDVQVDEKLLDIAKGRLGGWYPATGGKVELSYSLAALEQRRLGRDRSADKGPDTWRMRYCDLFDVPLERWPQDAVDYAIADAEGAVLVHDSQVEEGAHLLKNAGEQAYKSWALHLISCWGLKTDPENIAAFRREVEEEFAKAKKICEEAGLVRVKGRDKGKPGSRNTKKAAERMIAAMKAQGKEPKMTDGGESGIPQVSLDADACDDSLDPVLEAYAAITSLGSVVRDHIPALLKGVETPIQPSFENPLETGRVSCKGPDTGKKRPASWCPKRGLECILEDEEHRRCIRCGEYAPATNGYNTMNPRRKGGLRECFRARPGTYYADCDFSGLELNTVAQALLLIVGYSNLAEAINAGLDAHLAVAAELMGISYEEARHLRAQGDKQTNEFRGVGKVANFGFAGGLGVDGFVVYARKSYGVIVDYDTAAAAKRAWMRRWPEFEDYFRRIRDLCDAGGGLAHIVQLFTERERGMVPYTAAANGFFQALGADVAGRALTAVSRDCYDPTRASILFGSRIVNYVHDQLITEVPIAVAHEAAVEQARRMCEAGNVYLPDVPVRCEPALSTVWTKDAAAVYDAPPDAGGRLVPWDLAKAGRWKVWTPDGEVLKWKD